MLILLHTHKRINCSNNKESNSRNERNNISYYCIYLFSYFSTLPIRKINYQLQFLFSVLKYVPI